MPSAKSNDVRSINSYDSEEVEDEDNINFSTFNSPSMRSLYSNNLKQSKPSRPATVGVIRKSSATSLKRSRMTKSSINISKCHQTIQVINNQKPRRERHAIISMICCSVTFIK